MAETLVAVFLLAIVVERSVELAHSAKIFAPLRELIFTTAYPPDSPPLGPMTSWRDLSVRRAALFASTVLGCGYCTSVWVAMPFALVCPTPAGLHTFWLLDWVIKVVLLHGLSNLYHELYQLTDKKIVAPQFHDLKVTIVGDDDYEPESETDQYV